MLFTTHFPWRKIYIKLKDLHGDNTTIMIITKLKGLNGDNTNIMAIEYPVWLLHVMHYHCDEK